MKLFSDQSEVRALPARLKWRFCVTFVIWHQNIKLSLGEFFLHINKLLWITQGCSSCSLELGANFLEECYV